MLPLHLSIMSGSSLIFGIMPCSNYRCLFPDKPKTITFDAELLLSQNKDGEWLSGNTILHHFQTPGAPDPPKTALYYVAGKIASMKDNAIVGDEHTTNEYIAQIDAFEFHIMPNDVHPLPPTIVISGTVSATNPTSLSL